MAKNSRSKLVSKDVRDEAMKIARSRQIPGQTKEQTKLIAQGIESGIAQYLKQQSEKSRELDKKLKKVKHQLDQPVEMPIEEPDIAKRSTNIMLPWMLLGLSWLSIAIYLYYEYFIKN